MRDPVLDLTCELIRCQSVTPLDDGCQGLLKSRLATQGFAITDLDKADVSNFYATRGSGSPHFVFAGHTDVVPPGDLGDWTSPPFEPTLRGGYLFGRGAADMKSSLAAMIVATEEFLTKHPAPRGTLAFLITSDEEGPAEHGTRHVVGYLRETGCIPDLCVVGEPSSANQLCDTLRNGRRGSLNGQLTPRHPRTSSPWHPRGCDSPESRLSGLHPRRQATHQRAKLYWLRILLPGVRGEGYLRAGGTAGAVCSVCAGELAVFPSC